jgi:hypothetical protein
VEEGEIILSFLVPAHQHPAKAIHPPLRALHHPPPRPGTRVAFEGLGFFPPGPDVSREATLLERVPYLRVVIPFVQTPPLGPLFGGAGPLDDDTLEGLLDSLQVGPIGPGDPQAHRHPLPP